MAHTYTCERCGNRRTCNIAGCTDKFRICVDVCGTCIRKPAVATARAVPPVKPASQELLNALDSIGRIQFAGPPTKITEATRARLVAEEDDRHTRELVRLHSIPHDCDESCRTCIKCYQRSNIEVCGMLCQHEAENRGERE